MRLGVGASLCLVFLTVADVAVAANGWYLLVPPRSEYNERTAFLNGYRILDDKPLSQWAQQGAYDSASDCEGARNSLTIAEHRTYSLSSEAYIKAVGAGTDAGALKMQRFVTETNNANVSALMASRCIRSDDPRLRR